MPSFHKMASRVRSGAGRNLKRKTGPNLSATGGLGGMLGGAAALSVVATLGKSLGLPSIPGLDIASLMSNPLVLGAGAVALFVLLK